MNYPDLVQQLVQRRILRTAEIVAAFGSVHRYTYLPQDLRQCAGEDRPLPIGHGQTNSQPYTVAFMLELLQPRAGQRVLDVGCGSGWTTALLAHIVGSRGTVIGTERIADLADQARNRIGQHFGDNVSIVHTPSGIGHAELAPYDRILVSAAADKLPQSLPQQLAEGGLLVIPIEHSIFSFEKLSGELSATEYPGFSFVPLIDDATGQHSQW